LRGRLALTFEENGKRKRYSLNTTDRHEAEKIAPAIYAELTRPNDDVIDGLFMAYKRDKINRVIATNIEYTWRNLSKFFGERLASTIKIEDCRAYTALRREQGRTDGTIHTELNHLRIALNWAIKHQIIEKAPYIEMPKASEPRDRYLTHGEVARLVSYSLDAGHGR